MIPHRQRLDVLRREVQLFQDTCAELGYHDLGVETRCPGWTVRDQVAHLADTDEVAADTVREGPRAFARVVHEFPTPEAFTRAGCDRGKDMTLAELREWSVAASQSCVAALSDCIGTERVRWGFGMQATHLVMGRIMEYWTHHSDIRTALGTSGSGSVEGAICVAELSLYSVRYALAKARVTVERWPDVRLILVDEDSGRVHSLGKSDASELVSGSLQSWALLAAGRRNPLLERSFDFEGEYARLFIQIARAYL
ncbi:maleylpyruvate isomerase family mycothiol-dependent enzyme [Nocardia amamiensis]|uniref:maleylpyruvate isomerase family mycothiol-dependent enzyme n=1 Tax=Nocardia amamiensis TaxID=404578 RepID=UPI0009FD033A|nr:maleylpyruvate isomerase family mycothiol-dependent enzyme [Nocardia amamiensis]